MEGSFEAGLKRARADSAKLGLLVGMSTELQQRPWVGENKLVTEMAEAVGDEAPEDSPLALLGCRVVVDGHPDDSMNGRRGTIESYDVESGKYSVKFDDGSEELVDGQYLRRLDGSRVWGTAEEQQEAADEAAVREVVPLLLAATLNTTEEDEAGGEERGGNVGSRGGAAVIDALRSKHSSTCWFEGQRKSKVNAFNYEQQPYLAKRISSARLTRVQKAMKQIKRNNGASAAKAGGSGALPGDVKDVLQVGSDYAFAFEMEDGSCVVEFGRLEVMRSSGGDVLSEGAMLLDDAKRSGVKLVCQWFKEHGGTLTLGDVVHPVQYSAWCVIGGASLVLVDVATRSYRHADEHTRSLFDLACGATEPLAAAAVATAQPRAAVETKAETAARRKTQEDARKIERAAAASVDVAVVVRAEGKRRATQVLK